MVIGSLKQNFKSWRQWYSAIQISSVEQRKPKVFCIGLNKTGTTSIELALKNLGYSVGKQVDFENLIEDWAKRDFRRLTKLCFSAEAFQDVPFSLPFTYVHLFQAFPNSKFILSVRDSSEQWYDSITKFHSKKWADGQRIPTMEDLKEATYLFKGRPWLANRLQFSTPESEPYHRPTLLNYYQRHETNVEHFFQHASERLIKINVSTEGDYGRLCQFLDRTPIGDGFPWLNKTKPDK